MNFLSQHLLKTLRPVCNEQRSDLAMMKQDQRPLQRT